MGSIPIRHFFLINSDYTNLLHEFIDRLAPNLKILFPILFSNKVLDFHLFEFTLTEGKVSGRNLVTKSFTNLRYTERQFGMMGINNIFEVNKDALRRFWSQVANHSILARTNLGFENFVTKIGYMPRGFKHLRGTDNRSPNTIHILPIRYEPSPPEPLNII